MECGIKEIISVGFHCHILKYSTFSELCIGVLILLWWQLVKLVVVIIQGLVA